MEEKGPKRKQIIRNLKVKYRLVILDDQNFAEKFSLRLSPMNLFIWVGSLSLILIILTTVVIAYTPLREFIPGYPDGSERSEMLNARLRADSLESVVKSNDRYLSNVMTILRGEVPADSIPSDSVKLNTNNTVDLSVSPTDSAFRKKVEDKEKYELKSGNSRIAPSQESMYGIFFFNPLDGILTQSFDPQKDHFGVDIASRPNEAVKATLDGTVLFAGWTSDGGHEIHVQHSNNLVSVYKHNSLLLKRTGDKVKAGDPIAIVGDTGKLTEGPHLHFELWFKGTPIDPQNFLIF